MHKKPVAILILFFILINSCKTDFDIIAPYKETTVVYGLIDPNPAVQYQYIKINKAYLGEGNALVMAQQKDSINYAPGSLTVGLQKVEASGQVDSTIQFVAIDTVPKDPGIFSNPYQVLYINPKPISIAEDGSTYNLVIYNKSDKLTLSSSTNIVETMDSTFFSSPSQSPNVFVKLIDAPTTQFKVLFYAAKNARLYSLLIKFHYIEKNVATGDSSAKILNWDQGTQKSNFLLGRPEQITFVFNRTDFYGFVLSQLSLNPNLVRYVSAGKQLDFIITYAGDDLSTYIDVNQPSIGIIQERPEFSNIKNGIGIFSSRSNVILTRTLDQASYDSLLYGSVTGILNLQKQ